MDEKQQILTAFIRAPEPHALHLDNARDRHLYVETMVKAMVGEDPIRQLSSKIRAAENSAVYALLRLLQALDGFVLVYVFTESTVARNELRARLAESLKLRAIGFDVVADPDSDALLAKLWPLIEPPAAGKVPL